MRDEPKERVRGRLLLLSPSFVILKYERGNYTQIVFSTLSLMFGNVTKHGLSCFIHSCFEKGGLLNKTVRGNVERCYGEWGFMVL